MHLGEVVGEGRWEGEGWAERIELNSCFLSEASPTPKRSLINPPDQIIPPWEKKMYVYPGS